jgi:curved DNA-binding protein CbpA
MAEAARALLQAGRIHELLNVKHDTTNAEIKKSCKQARIRNHPDKGGDLELFKVVENAIELLTNELPTFDGNIPPWLNNIRNQIESIRNQVRNLERQHSELAKIGKLIKKRSDVDMRLARAVSLLQEEREKYKWFFNIYLQEREEEKAMKDEAERAEAERVERSCERVRRARIQLQKERHALRKRCSRPASNRFPTLPEGVKNIHFDKVRKRYRALSQTRSRYTKDEKDTTAIDNEMQVLLVEAQDLANAALNARCEQREIHTSFPRLAKTDPKYDALMSLRLARRRLCDRIRKSSDREDLQEESAEILRQAWAICRAPTESSSPNSLLGNFIA